MRKSLFILTVIAFTMSCDRERVYEQFTAIKEQSWNSFDILHFNVNISDTASGHNVFITVRNTGQYEFSNLYLFVTAHSPNGSYVSDTLEIMLADEHGKWLGKGSAAVHTLYFPYKQNIRFNEKGIYQFDIEQAMWIKELKHLTHVGMRVEKAKNK